MFATINSCCSFALGAWCYSLHNIQNGNTGPRGCNLNEREITRFLVVGENTSLIGSPDKAAPRVAGRTAGDNLMIEVFPNCPMEQIIN